VRPYVVAVIALAIALGLRALIVDATGADDAPFVLFFAAVLVAAIYGGPWPGVVTVIIATILVNWLFLGSRGSFSTGAADIVACVLFLIEGLAVSIIGWQVRHNLRRLGIESRRREALADISTHALAGANSEDLMVHCCTMAGRMLDCEFADIWLTNATGEIVIGPGDEPRINDVQASLMRDLVRGNRTVLMPTRAWIDAGATRPGVRSSNTPAAGAVALLTAPEKPFGVLAVSSRLPRGFSPADLAFLQTAAALLSAALQRDRYTEALRRNESRLREVTDMAPMFIWIADAQGQLAFFNKRLLTFTGWTLEEQVREGWAGIVHPDDIDIFLDAFQDAVDRRAPFEGELRLQGADGSYRWFLNRAVPAPSSDGASTGYIGSSIDITDRRRAMEALRAMADLGAELSRTLNQIDVAQVLSHCVVTHGLADIAVVALGGHDGHFYDATACQLGTSDDSIVKQLAQGFRDDTEENLLLDITRLTGPAVIFSDFGGASSALGPAQAGIVRQAGCAQLAGVPLSARGRTVGALALFLAAGRPAPDASELQLVGEMAGRAALAIDNAGLYAESQRQTGELQRSNDALQFLANAGIEFSRLLQDGHTMQRVAELAVPTFADIAIIDVARPDGQLDRLGVAASTDRLAGLVQQIRPRHDYGTGRVARELRSGHSTMISRVRPRHLRLFGEYIEDAHILSEIAPSSALFVPMTARGQVLGLLTFIRVGGRPPFTSADLLGVGEQLGRRAGLSVDNARLFADAQAREAELREANIAKDEFLGLMSHELRTPITVINGGARILVQRSETLPTEARAEIITDVAREADRLAAMLEDLLALARIELNKQPVVEPVLLHRFIEGLAEKARPAHREIRMTITGDLPPVAAEPAYIDHVFRNLMSNANKYSPADSPIDVVVESGEGCIVVRVLDRGPGIAPDDTERIFERFYRSNTTARLASGAGMGLAVCKRLVETMSGEIWARPREGGGLEVGFSLPLYEEEDV
jgi:PAS domain S-box-containing protein